MNLYYKLDQHIGEMKMLSKVIDVIHEMLDEKKSLIDFADWCVKQTDIEQIKRLENMSKVNND